MKENEGLSFWDGLFSRAMENFQGVYSTKRVDSAWKRQNHTRGTHQECLEMLSSQGKTCWMFNREPLAFDPTTPLWWFTQKKFATFSDPFFPIIIIASCIAPWPNKETKPCGFYCSGPVRERREAAFLAIKRGSTQPCGPKSQGIIQHHSSPPSHQRTKTPSNTTVDGSEIGRENHLGWC